MTTQTRAKMIKTDKNSPKTLRKRLFMLKNVKKCNFQTPFHHSVPEYLSVLTHSALLYYSNSRLLDFCRSLYLAETTDLNVKIGSPAIKYEKTNPISKSPKTTQLHTIQAITSYTMSLNQAKTNPIQTQFRRYLLRLWKNMQNEPNHETAQNLTSYFHKNSYIKSPHARGLKNEPKRTQFSNSTTNLHNNHSIRFQTSSFAFTLRCNKIPAHT